MQRNLKDFNPKIHIKFRALTVKQPYADLIAEGKKTIEVRSKNTSCRGMVLITSSASPKVEGRSGVTICVADIAGTEKITANFPDKEKTCIPDEVKIYGYAWYLKNIRKVNPVPVKGQLGIYSLILDKGDIRAEDEINEEMKRELWYDREGCFKMIITVSGLLFAAFCLLYGISFIFGRINA